MRIFNAIAVPEEIKQQALQIKNELSQLILDVKWVEYENYHITLKFLGEVDQRQLTRIKDKLALASHACPPIKLQSSKIGFFPSPSRPRILWLGIKGELEKANYLGQKVDTYLEELGFAVERKRSFHLTLGRIRSDSNMSELVSRVGSINNAIKAHDFEVRAFSLMESQLFSAGPQYTELEKYSLTGGPFRQGK